MNSHIRAAIDQTEWASLWTMYGDAGEAPRHFAALENGDDEAKSAAWEFFYNHVFHQGTRSQSAIAAVPVFHQMLLQPGCAIRRELIDVLLTYAVSVGENFLPHGYDFAGDPDAFGEGAGGICGYLAEEYQTLLAVKERAETFLTYLSPEFDPETRLSAAFASAHFAQPLSGKVGDVMNLAETETCPRQLESLILCAGMMGRFAAQKPDPDWFASFLDSQSHSPEIQVCAAIALATAFEGKSPQPAIHRLITALSENEPLKSAREERQWWNEGDLIGYAALVLPLVAKVNRDLVAKTLCEALTKLETCTFAIPVTLLQILFPAPPPENGWEAEAMDELQLKSLRILIKTPHWRKRMFSKHWAPDAVEPSERNEWIDRVLVDVSGGDYGPNDPVDRLGNVSSWDLEKHW